MTEPDHAILQLIAERLDATMAADQLAAAVARLAGVDIGEHTDDNDPWRNALDAADRLNGRAQAAAVVQSQAEMNGKYTPFLPLADLRDLEPVEPVIYKDIAKRYPPGVEPPADLVDEFPAELANPSHCGESVPQSAMATTPESGEQ